jgi:hypothetical protein
MLNSLYRILIIVLIISSQTSSVCGQYLDTVHKTDFQHELTFSYNWDHTYLTSVSELRDSNKTLYGWTYLQFKQYDEDFNIINEKRYTDSNHFTGGHRSLTFYENAYYFPKTNMSIAFDTIKALVLKLDTVGNVIWEKKYFDNFYKVRTSNIVIQNNNLFISGWRVANNGDDSEVFILKTDTSGNILQSKFFSSLTEYPILLSICADGGFLMSNQFGQPYVDTKIYKLDNNLNVIWTKVIDSSPEGTIVSAQETPDGSIIFIGTSKHPLNSTERSYMGKISANGLFLKDTIYDLSTGLDAFDFNGSRIWKNDGFYVRGVIYDDLSADTSRTALYYFDYDLNLKWQRKYAKRESENGIGFIKQLDNDFIVMSGYVFPDDSNATADEWFMVVDSMGCQNLTCVASLSIEDNYYLETNEILLYPNPASIHIFLKNEDLNMGGSSYKIYNSVGQESQSGLISNGQIDISDLTLGFYIFTTYHKGKHYKSSLIISR